MHYYYPRHADRTALLEELQSLGFYIDEEGNPINPNAGDFSYNSEALADCIWLEKPVIGEDEEEPIYSDMYCANIVSKTELEFAEGIVTDKPSNPVNVWDGAP